MKYYLYVSLSIALLMGANKTSAQTEQSSDPNVVSGHFEIHVVSGTDTNHVNVNYAISPAPFTNIMNLELSTPNTIFFNADILDATNNVLVTWAPTAGSNYYSNNLDISSLPAGNYHVNIHRDNTTAILYSIPFTK